MHEDVDTAAFSPLFIVFGLCGVISTMEEGYKKLIDRHRDKFRHAVTVERLFSPLVVSHVVNSEEAQAIQADHPSQRVDRLLDVIQRKDFETFKKFCVVLETTYPYMLNCMFLAVEPPATTGE